jgi:hypothetical protein
MPYLFLVDSPERISELPSVVRELPDYIFHTLTDEHIMKLVFLQKMKMAPNIKEPSPIFICWHESIELEDLRDSIHPKLYAMLKYSAHSYGIFHRRILDLTNEEMECIKEQAQKKYTS